jgi:hypothetical protein
MSLTGPSLSHTSVPISRKEIAAFLLTCLFPLDYNNPSQRVFPLANQQAGNMTPLPIPQAQYLEVLTKFC